jgi:hypothetical protein
MDDPEKLKATIDSVITDLAYVKSLVPVPLENSGLVAEMLGRLAHEIRTAAYLLGQQ